MRTLACCVVAAGLAFGDKSADSLKGETAIKVLVEDLGRDIQGDGLTVEQLQTDVELKLRLAGLNVDNRVSSYLYIQVTTLKDKNIYAFSTHISFNQEAIRNMDILDLWNSSLPPGWKPGDKEPPIFRESVAIMLIQKSMPVTTWSHGVIGTVGSSNVQQIRGFVKDSVDRFLNDWLKANPKKP